MWSIIVDWNLNAGTDAKHQNDKELDKKQKIPYVIQLRSTSTPVVYPGQELSLNPKSLIVCTSKERCKTQTSDLERLPNFTDFGFVTGREIFVTQSSPNFCQVLDLQKGEGTQKKLCLRSAVCLMLAWLELFCKNKVRHKSKKTLKISWNFVTFNG